MRLFTSPRAPNPRRVLMFLHEKGITGIERRAKSEEESEAGRKKQPMAQRHSFFLRFPVR